MQGYKNGYKVFEYLVYVWFMPECVCMYPNMIHFLMVVYVYVQMFRSVSVCVYVLTAAAVKFLQSGIAFVCSVVVVLVAVLQRLLI